MSADHSEARERARQEFEKWAKSWYLGKRNYAGEMCDGSWVYRADAIQHAWAGWNGRGRSLEQERDEAWKDYITQVWMDPMLTGKKVLKALIAGPPVHKGDS